MSRNIAGVSSVGENDGRTAPDCIVARHGDRANLGTEVCDAVFCVDEASAWAWAMTGGNSRATKQANIRTLMVFMDGSERMAISYTKA